MKVARHVTPGIGIGMIRPVGNGMIRVARSRPSGKTIERPRQHDHTVPYGTGFSMPRFQAFHAWLPSFHPYGTIPFRPYADLNRRQPNTGQKSK
jgi:hypothetical protein